MLSRLIILSMAREIALAMEEAGVSTTAATVWQSRLMSDLMTPATTVQDTRLIEDAMAKAVKAAMKMISEAYDAAE